MPNKRLGDEYPPKSGIIITLKKNPSGSKAYRVDIPATITGRSREQRQFPTQREAQEHAARRHDEVTRFGHVAFSLTATQRNDAARAIGLLTAYGMSLVDAAKLAIAHTPRIRDKTTIDQIRTLFLASPGRRKKKLTQRRLHTYRGLKWRTARFAKRFGAMTVSAIDTAQVKDWMNGLGDLSPVSLNNMRRAIHALFSFAASEGYCAANPVTAIPLYHVPERAPVSMPITLAFVKRTEVISAAGILSVFDRSATCGKITSSSVQHWPDAV